MDKSSGGFSQRAQVKASRPQTANVQGRKNVRTISFTSEGQHYTAHSTPVSPRDVFSWHRLFRPFVAPHTARSPQSSHMPNALPAPPAPPRPIAMKTFKLRIKPQVAANGFAIGKAFAQRELLPKRTLRSTVNSLSEKDLIGIARSKSIETMLQLAVGSREDRSKQYKKPRVGKMQRKRKKAEPSTLLNRISHAESHTKEEQEARNVMDNLYKKFSRGEPCSSVSTAWTLPNSPCTSPPCSIPNSPKPIPPAPDQPTTRLRPTSADREPSTKRVVFDAMTSRPARSPLIDLKAIESGLSRLSPRSLYSQLLQHQLRLGLQREVDGS